MQLWSSQFLLPSKITVQNYVHSSINIDVNTVWNGPICRQPYTPWIYICNMHILYMLYVQWWNGQLADTKSHTSFIHYYCDCAICISRVRSMRYVCLCVCVRVFIKIKRHNWFPSNRNSIEKKQQKLKRNKNKLIPHFNWHYSLLSFQWQIISIWIPFGLKFKKERNNTKHRTVSFFFFSS